MNPSLMVVALYSHALEQALMPREVCMYEDDGCAK